MYLCPLVFLLPRMQVVRLPDWKLLIYTTIPLIALLGMLSVVQAVDPLRPMLHRKSGAIRDTTFYYCGTGDTGVGLSATIGVLMVRLLC